MYPIVDSGVTNLIHDRRSCVDFTLEVEANVARCVHSSVNKPDVIATVGYETFTHCRLYCEDRGKVGHDLNQQTTHTYIIVIVVITRATLC